MGFRLATIADRAVLVDGDGWHDLAAASDGAFTGDPMEAVRRHAELHTVAEAVGDRAPDGLVADATFGPPVPAPRSVFAVGLNYADHVGEAQMEVPENPLIFTKFPSCLVGPTDDIVLNSTAGDYEAELVVVIGEGGRDIAADEGVIESAPRLRSSPGNALRADAVELAQRPGKPGADDSHAIATGNGATRGIRGVGGEQLVPLHQRRELVEGVGKGARSQYTARGRRFWRS